MSAKRVLRIIRYACIFLNMRSVHVKNYIFFSYFFSHLFSFFSLKENYNFLCFSNPNLVFFPWMDLCDVSIWKYPKINQNIFFRFSYKKTTCIFLFSRVFFQIFLCGTNVKKYWGKNPDKIRKLGIRIIFGIFLDGRV